MLVKLTTFRDLSLFQALAIIFYLGLLLFFLPFFSKTWFLIQGLVVLLFILTPSAIIRMSLLVLWLSYFVQTLIHTPHPSELYKFYHRINPHLTRWLIPQSSNQTESYRDLIEKRQYIFSNEGWLNDGNIFFENSLDEILKLNQKIDLIFLGKPQKKTYVGSLSDLECEQLAQNGFDLSSAFQVDAFKTPQSCGVTISLESLEIVLKNYQHIIFFNHSPLPLVQKNYARLQNNQDQLLSIWDCRTHQIEPFKKQQTWPLISKSDQFVYTQQFRFHSRRCNVYVRLTKPEVSQWNKLSFLKRMFLWQIKE